ncbi:Integral membrane ankyrin-repeat protein, partial [Globisporangium splendens]
MAALAHYILSQRTDGFDAPIAFYSKKFGDYEEKWPAHEKELLAIKVALSKWRHYLHGRQFDVFTDNSACRWMLHQPKVTPKLARMLTFFSQFDFVLRHVKGSTNVVADALSRPGPEEVKSSNESPEVSTPEVHACDDACRARSQSISRRVVSAAYLRHLPDSDCSAFLSAVDFRGERRAVAVRQEQVHTVDAQWASVHLSEATKKAFQAGYSRDPSFAKVWQSREGNNKFEKRNGLLFLRTKHPVLRLCVPNSNKLITDVIQEFHDAPVVAHPGDIHEYVGSCQTCARWKSNNRKKIGLTMPIPAPQECWDVLSMDFITGLPVSEGFDAIFVTADKLSKRPKYHPTHSTADAEGTTKVFFEAVVRHHGLPKVIISDRDPKFTLDFWKSLTKLMGIKLSMTTSHRAQADGQTERQNLVLEDALRCMVSYHGDDWVSHLGTIEFAHATLVNESTKFTPFEVDTGRKVRNLIAQEFGVEDGVIEQVDVAEFAKNFTEKRQQIIKLAQENLKQAQERQKKYYDRKRRDVEFEAGNIVMLDTKNLPLKTVARSTSLQKAKLAAKKVGPFKIDAMVNKNVARLVLPPNMKRLHPAFNVELLSHYVENPTKFYTRPIPKAAPVILDDETGEALHSMWLVKWLGYPAHESKWEYEKNIRHVSHWHRLLQEFQDSQREVKSGGMSRVPDLARQARALQYLNVNALNVLADAGFVTSEESSGTGDEELQQLTRVTQDPSVIVDMLNGEGGGEVRIEDLLHTLFVAAKEAKATPILQCLRIIKKNKNAEELMKRAVTEEDDTGLTLLMISVRNNMPTISALLIQEGADVNQWNEKRTYALLLAAQKGLDDITKLLLENGANEESKNMSLIPASHFGHLSAVQLLLEFGANQNYSNKKGTTPLMRAAQEGRENVVRFLISKGADACAANTRQGSTALLLAAKRGHTAAVESLLTAGADIFMKDDRDKTAAETAYRRGHIDLFLKITESFGDDDVLRQQATQVSTVFIQAPEQETLERHERCR